jgi:signal peptidase II
LEPVLRKFLRSYGFLFTVAALVIALDQWTKFLVRTKLPFEEMWAPWDWLLPYARIVHWKNSGAAFGMLQQFGGVFTVLAVLVAIAILYYFPQVPRQDWTLRVAMGLQFGGALGNLIDRVTQGGYVTDFISVGSFPVFNVADASISVGVAVLILGMWLKERHERHRGTGTSQDSDVSPPESSPPAPYAISGNQEEVRGE